jgi:hypothetical protein
MEDDYPASMKSKVKGIQGTLNLIAFLLMGVLYVVWQIWETLEGMAPLSTP